MLKALGAAMAVPGTGADGWRRVAAEVAEPALSAIEEMIFKEERILLPMALQNLSEREWGEIWAQSPQRRKSSTRARTRGGTCSAASARDTGTRAPLQRGQRVSGRRTSSRSKRRSTSTTCSRGTVDRTQ